ncbi:MAG: hypothetical protein ACLR8M_08585 [Oscillospiraceae bacterium]
MKKLFTLFLAILCLLTMLSIPVFAADAGVEPYGTPGSGYDQKNFTFNRSTYTAKLYLQFNSSYVAKSRCETVAETQIDHKALTVEFKTYRNGYQTILGGARSYTIAQKIQAGTNTYSNGVIYSTLTDHATGVNFIAGSVIVNSSTTLSATLGSRSAG